jgi:hypothetical protein
VKQEPPRCHCCAAVMRHGVDDVNHHPVGNPKRKV